MEVFAVASDWQPLLEAVRRSRLQIALVVTGGGAGAVSQCFRRIGASENFVEASIPYSTAARNEYLGSEVTGSSVSGPVARRLAQSAHRRVVRWGGSQLDPAVAVGIGLTGALPTTPTRRGQDRIHVALHAQRRQVLWSLALPADGLSRESAETIADEMVYHVLAELVAEDTAGRLTNNRFFEDAGLDLNRE